MGGTKRKRGRKPKNHSTVETTEMKTNSSFSPEMDDVFSLSKVEIIDASGASTIKRRPGRPPKKDKHPENVVTNKASSPTRRISRAEFNGDCVVHNSVVVEAVPSTLESVAKVVPSMDAVVKVFCVHTEPNLSLPWQRKRQYSSSSSGFVIGGKRVLTNAHSVEHYTQVKLKKRGSDTKYLATVLAVGTECDIGRGFCFRRVRI